MAQDSHQGAPELRSLVTAEQGLSVGRWQHKLTCHCDLSQLGSDAPRLSLPPALLSGFSKSSATGVGRFISKCQDMHFIFI